MERLAETRVRVAKNANKIMFLLTEDFRFLDIINYLGPGVSWDAWVKTYGCKTGKSSFPYEWFDKTDKLDYLGLSGKIKMQTFVDRLRYHNHLNVVPGLLTCPKMPSACSICFVSAIDQGADLWSPCKEACYMLKGVVVCGPSLVFTRYHEAGVT